MSGRQPRQRGWRRLRLWRVIATGHGTLAGRRGVVVVARVFRWPATDLPAMAKAANPGGAGAVSLRRIMTHMFEETARHAGHPGILREQIDGATGL